MKIKFLTEIPPSDLAVKSCLICTHSKLQTYADEQGNIIDVPMLCVVNYKRVDPTIDSISCTAFEPMYFDYLRINNYTRLQ